MEGLGQWGLIVEIGVALAMSLGSPQAAPHKFTLTEGNNILWTDPGDVASLDFEYGIGGSEHQPQPPFHFLNEDFSGSNPKVNVTDRAGTKWNVKWGHEASPSTFCTRLLWACGYFAETEYFLPRGRIDGAHDLKRAHSYIAEDGSFVNAR